MSGPPTDPVVCPSRAILGTATPSRLTRSRGPSILEVLPTELIEAICRAVADISVQESRKLRLVSRVFNQCASRYGLPELTVYLHQSDFNALRMIACQPGIAAHVKTFNYFAWTVEKPTTLEQMLYNYREDRREAARDAPPNRRRRILKERPLTRHQLHRHWTKAKDYYNMQQALLADDDDEELFEDVLPLLPNLEELNMMSDPLPIFGMNERRKTPFDDGLAEFYYKPTSPEGMRAMANLLMNVPRRNKIKVLRAVAIDWRFFEPTNEPMGRFRDLAVNLSTLDLRIETGYDDERGATGTEVVECKELMKSGALRDLLKRATKLESLTVVFESINDLDGFPTELNDIIPINQRWPSLKRLGLGAVECERGELEGLLRRHASTINVIQLRDISLRFTSWIKFIDEVYGMLHHRLDDADICGQLFGEDEDTHQPEYWEVMEPESGLADSLREDISGYLVCRNPGCAHPPPFMMHPSHA